MPLPPPPINQESDVDYLTQLSELTKDGPPSILVHAKTNVIFTDL